MRILNQLFIAIISIAVAVALYNGLSFSLIEAIIAGTIIGTLCLVLIEIRARRNADANTRKAVEDLSRLLAQNAQAGQTLSIDVRKLKSLDTDARVTSLEADLSVLGTIVRQLSDTVTHLESENTEHPDSEPDFSNVTFETSEPGIETIAPNIVPSISISTLKQAIADNRIEPFMQPVVTLPRRKVTAYELLARLRRENGEIAEAIEFMPSTGGKKTVPQIDNLMILRAVQIIRRLSARQQKYAVHVNLSQHTLASEPVFAGIIEFLTANIALRDTLFFELDQSEFENLSREQLISLERLTQLGFGLILDKVSNLRLDFVDLASRGFHTMKITATQFLEDTKQLTDIHIADIVDLLSRHEIELIVTRVEREDQVLMLLDERVSYASGNHFSEARPVRTDVLEPEDANGFDILPRDVMPRAGE